MLLYHDDLLNIPINYCGYGLLYIAAILTLWSMVNYLKAALAVLTTK
jgi:hypothetical protein